MGTLSSTTIRPYICLPVLMALWLLCSCSNTGPRSGNPAFFNTVTATAAGLADKGMKDKAIALLDSVYRIHPEAGPEDLYKNYALKTAIYRGMANYPKATLYADSMASVLMPYMKDGRYNLQYAEANIIKGDILFEQGFYADAYHAFYLGEAAAEKSKDSCAYGNYLAHFRQRLAMISYTQDDFRKALDFFKQAISSLHNCNGGFEYTYDMQGNLSNIAFCYRRMDMPDSTLYYYNKCLAFLAVQEPLYPPKKDFIAMARGVIYGNMGDAYMLKGQYPMADSFYKEAVRINSQKGYYNQDALMTELKRARMYVKTGRLKEAGDIIAKAGVSPDLVGNESKQSFLQARADYHTAIGQEKETIKDLEAYIKLKDSIQRYRLRLASPNISNVFQVLKQEYDHNALIKQAELKNTLLVAAIVMLVMAILIILLTIKSSMADKRHIKKVKQHYKEQQFALQVLEQSNRDNARLTSVLAHDLKNPIHAISAIASLMLDEKNRSEDDMEMLGLVRESVGTLSDIIDNVLIAGKRHGAIVLHKNTVNLVELLKHSVALLQFKAKEKRQKIKLEYSGHIFIHIDSDQVWRVINNLLVNAIKFSYQDTLITVAVKKVETMVQVSVEDEGVGVPEHLGNKIFELFPGAQRTGTSGEETFGLGLYISRQIVEAHDGKIWFEKAPCKGTIFYICLPL